MVNKNVLALLTKQSLKQWTALFHDALVGDEQHNYVHNLVSEIVPRVHHRT